MLRDGKPIGAVSAALDEAISVSPMEHLQKRIAVLEQKVGAGSEPPRNQMESKPGQSV
jgi:hypothetical protein